jgi:hypothetical protein
MWQCKLIRIRLSTVYWLKENWSHSKLALTENCSHWKLFWGQCGGDASSAGATHQLACVQVECAPPHLRTDFISSYLSCKLETENKTHTGSPMKKIKNRSDRLQTILIGVDFVQGWLPPPSRSPTPIWEVWRFGGWMASATAPAENNTTSRVQLLLLAFHVCNPWPLNRINICSSSSEIVALSRRHLRSAANACPECRCSPASSTTRHRL